jgi:autotransporter-associated beta strand protein
MGSFSWVRWLRSSRRPEAKISRRPARRLDLEHLETRVVPAGTFTWDGRPDNGGTSSDNRWSTGTNWVGDVAPNPADFDTLVFPNGAAQLASQNDLPNAVFNQIIFSGGGYNLSGNSITLGNSTSGTGLIEHNAGTATDTISFNIQMGGSAGNKQFFTVDTSGGVLDIAGSISGNTGVELSQGGPGTLQLDNNNSAFTGKVSVTAGALRITNNQALGSGPFTTVATNAQLQVSNVTGAINTPLRLNGPGLGNTGALLNVSGNNTWAGGVELDSDATVGAALNTSLTINGVISDLGSGHALTKEQPGQIILDPLNNAAGNTYRGLTTVNAGTLTIRHSHALGTGDAGTVVNSGALESGTLDLQFVPNAARIDPFATATGFTVPDEQLTINGPGREGLDQIIITQSSSATGTPSHVDSGSLHNQAGNNSWQQNIQFWTDPSQIPPPFIVTLPVAPFVEVFAYNHLIVGVEANSSLTINGKISDNANGTAYEFDKDRPGTLILTNANTFTGATEVLQGTLDIRDSQALGPTGSTSTVSVFSGGTLALEADAIPDSVTPNSTDLTISKKLILVGGGSGGAGALHNLIGRNKWNGTINLLADATIGVDIDPDPRGTDAFPYNDFSQLTVNGVISGGGVFTKNGLGELVLTASNTYSNRTMINQGWVTITNSGALGTNDNGRVSANHDLAMAGTASVQDTVVASGAALHLKSASGNMTIGENLVLNGLGITSANTINSDLYNGPNGTGLGALVNLVGDNVLTGNILLAGGPTANPGIGVETSPAYPNTAPFSQLTLKGALEEVLPIGTASTGFVKLGTQRLILQGPGYYTGNVDVKQGVLRIQNSEALGYNGTASGSANTTTVESGAALELMESVSSEAGGEQAGLELGLLKSLILSGPGNNTTPSGHVDPLAVIPPTASMTQDAGGDHMIRGNITLKTDSTTPDIHISVPVNARLQLLGNIDDQTSTNPSGAGI